LVETHFDVYAQVLHTTSFFSAATLSVGYPTCKIVPEMTYNVSSGTFINPTTLYYTITYHSLHAVCY